MKEGGRRRREREKWRRGSEGDEKKEGGREGKERKDIYRYVQSSSFNTHTHVHKPVACYRSCTTLLFPKTINVTMPAGRLYIPCTLPIDSR